MNHGTLTMYTKRRCRCEPCREVARRYNKQYRLKRHQGVARLVDAAPVHAHVQKLRAAGISDRSITMAAGYGSRNSLFLLMQRDRVRAATAIRILSVRLEDCRRPLTYVDATGSRRRLQALAAIGWPYREIADRLGADHKGLQNVQSGLTLRVRHQTAEAVRALYDELWDQPGPSSRAAAIARGKGWAVPVAWDDDEIDDPQATPHAPDDRRANGGRPFEYVIEDFQHTYTEHGGDVALAAQRLGLSRDAMSRALYRARANGLDITFTDRKKGAA